MASVVDLLVGNAARVALHRPWPRAVVTPDMWNMAADHLARGHWILLGLWGEADAVHMALIDEQTSEIGVISLECPDRSYPSIGMLHPPAIRLERAIRDLFGHDAIGLPDTRPWLDHGRWDIAHPLGSRPDTTPVRRIILSCLSKGTAFTRSRSAPSMRASSSPAISASRQTARRWFDLKSGSVMFTRESRA